MQKIIRHHEFDAGHRVVNHNDPESIRGTCSNVHGHRYRAIMEFNFADVEEIGFAIDFKEIKRIGSAWLDDMMDHSFIANPKDTPLLETLKHIHTNIYEMSINGKGQYCNPTAENMSKEIFLAMELLFANHKGLKINKITLYETPNCWVECDANSIKDYERMNFAQARAIGIKKFLDEKGVAVYDDRLIN